MVADMDMFAQLLTYYLNISLEYENVKSKTENIYGKVSEYFLTGRMMGVK